ncbi:hypothetical protein FSP39_001076 [Pinctada imbricata]|uniref:Uncharacterized protein n=1 Tax=Pinctada imbricata TaxID=66713 RepID=A0AA88XXK4_PINIB|nr:hypothetical protein FSP39_001076 [Pinctada imbricata]
MPGDIGGLDARLARPKTSPGVLMGRGERTHGEDGEEEYHVELLEYEWPDLPPLPHFKDAITRKTVSKGISYLLPVDKGKNSINSQYRTDLRAMFQEPYSDENLLGFDEGKVKLSAKVHFDTNSADLKWSKKHLTSIPFSLNSESENVRRLYARSAPAGGSRGTGFSVDKMRTRSSLYLPMKTKAHPEALKLRKEVEEIVKSVQVVETDYDDNLYTDKMEEETVETANTGKSFKNRGSIGNVSVTSSHYAKPGRLKLTAEKFSTYDQLRTAKPPKPTIPDVLKSRFLTPVKNQEIWEWLHYGEEMTEFEYFLSVCG